MCEDVSAEGVISGGGTRAAPDAATYFDAPERFDGYISYMAAGSSPPAIISYVVQCGRLSSAPHVSTPRLKW